MKTALWLCLGVVLWASACTGSLTTPSDPSKATVIVHVTRLVDAAPVAGVLTTAVTDSDAHFTTQAHTDAQGTATLVVQPGTVIISVDHADYQYRGRDLGPVTAGQVLDVSVVLEPK